ncbi:MAG: protein kinase [Blastocatellia bacterium]
MKQVTAERLQQIKTLFDVVFDLPPNERERTLAQACAGDERLFAEVQKLLLLHDHAPDFLEAPPLNDFPHSSAAIASDAALGRRIGAYQVIRELGRGGMGAVFLAHRADQAFEKQVAIKLVWPGLGSEEIIQRFQQERQILARLEHKNIARLLDGGVTEDGWHYLVMEYIAGVPLTLYCEQQLHSLPERLKLFRLVCQAVQAAHQNLVIHRDLKPGNILVTADGTPKLLDFGIAKLLEQNDASLALTHTQLPLTPEYASPEQLNNEAITKATDIYSLGVVLYEILTGRKPYQFKSPLLHEIARVVTEVEPEKPNVDEDLANIVLMALRKEPTRRYPSVEQFNADIGRYLEGKTVLARKATASYRVGKFVRRHMLPVLLITLLLLTLITVAVVSFRQAAAAHEQARSQRRELYATRLNQAVQDWELGNLSRMRTTLAAWLPQSTPTAEEDLRGFEWRYLWSLCHPKSVQFKHSAAAELGGLGFYDHDNFVGGSSQTKADLWDAQTGQLLNSLAFTGYQHGYSIWLEKDFPVQRCGNEMLQVLNLRTGQPLYSVALPAHTIINFWHQGSTIATGHTDGSVKFWEMPTGKLTASLPCQTTPIDGMFFSPDWQKLFTRPNPQEWRLHDIRQGTYQTIPANSLTTAPQVSLDSRYFCLSEGGQAVRLFALATGREIGRLTVPGERLLFTYFSPDSRYLIVTSTDSTARLYQLPSLQQVAVFRSNNDWMPSAFVSPDGKLLLAICGALTVKLWDIATQQEVALIKGHEAKIIGAQFSHDGNKLLTWSEDGVARIWNIADLRKLDHLTEHTDGLFAVAFSPDSQLLARQQRSHHQLWATATGQLLRTINGHTDWVFAVALRPTARRWRPAVRTERFACGTSQQGENCGGFRDTQNPCAPSPLRRMVRRWQRQAAMRRCAFGT